MPTDHQKVTTIDGLLRASRDLEKAMAFVPELSDTALRQDQITSELFETQGMLLAKIRQDELLGMSSLAPQDESTEEETE